MTTQQLANKEREIERLQKKIDDMTLERERLNSRKDLALHLQKSSEASAEYVRRELDRTKTRERTLDENVTRLTSEMLDMRSRLRAAERKEEELVDTKQQLAELQRQLAHVSEDHELLQAQAQFDDLKHKQL